MIYSHWPTGDYPILVNPSPDEYHHISNQRWDSLRVMHCPVSGNIGIASGYGNTHQSVMHAMQKVLASNRVYPYDMIIYKSGDRVFINGELHGGKYEESWATGSEQLSDEHKDILEDIIKETGYCLY